MKMIITKNNNDYTILYDSKNKTLISKYLWFLDNYGYVIGYKIGIPVRKQKLIKMHRLIMKINDKNIFCDHKNMNIRDNRIKNLRLCTISESNKHKKSKKSKSTYRDVSFIYTGKEKKKRIKSAIRFNGKILHLGYFKTELDAALAYNLAAKKYHSEFATLNNI